MSGAAPRPVAEWQLGNFGQSATVGIPMGMRLDVWNDYNAAPTLNLYARNGQSVMLSLQQNAAVTLSGRLFSSVTLTAGSTPYLNNQIVWALVDEFSPPTWGPVSGQVPLPYTRITNPSGAALPVAWDGSGGAPADGRFFGYVVATAAAGIAMVVGSQSSILIATATASGQSFPFEVFVQAGDTVKLVNANIVAAGITL